MNASLTQESILHAFKELEIQSGDTVFVHSDLRVFGIPAKAQSRQEILQFYQKAFESILGPEGTLAVPTYFYEYARHGIPFDVDSSPVSTSLGSFSQWINEQPNRIRSCNPLQSIAAIGKNAEKLAGGHSLAGYGVSSPWHFLRILNGKILFLGAPVQAMTYVHHIEQEYGVPHLYFKIYPYPVIKKGKQLPGNPISAVRYLAFAIEYNLAAFEKELERQGVLRSCPLNGVTIKIVNAEDAFQVGIACLSQNPYAFLKQAPQFVPGTIPTDGITGSPI